MNFTSNDYIVIKISRRIDQKDIDNAKGMDTMPGVMVEWKTVPEVEADPRFADDDMNKEFRRLVYIY